MEICFMSGGASYIGHLGQVDKNRINEFTMTNSSNNPHYHCTKRDKIHCFSCGCETWAVVNGNKQSTSWSLMTLRGRRVSWPFRNHKFSFLIFRSPMTDFMLRHNSLELAFAFDLTCWKEIAWGTIPTKLNAFRHINTANNWRTIPAYRRKPQSQFRNKFSYLLLIAFPFGSSFQLPYQP